MANRLLQIQFCLMITNNWLHYNENNKTATEQIENEVQYITTIKAAQLEQISPVLI